MKKFAKLTALLLAAVLLLLCAGCRGGDSEIDDDLAEGLVVYYRAAGGNTLTAKRAQVPSAGPESTAREILTLMETPPDTSLRRARPEQAELRDLHLDGEILTLVYGLGYTEADPVDEILYRAAVVRALCRIDGVSGVQFYVGDVPLADSRGAVVGILNAESFVETDGSVVTRVQVADLVLYFADAAGTALYPLQQRVRYSGSYSLERAVVIQLLRGPSGSGYSQTIPAGTTLLGITVKDGVCYVDLDEHFVEDLAAPPQLPLYSLVNSLTELPSVSKVQISVNGSTDVVFGGLYPLSTLFERDPSLIGTQVQQTQPETQP